MAELGIDLGTWSVAAALLDGRGRRLVPDPVSGQSWFRAGVALAPDGSWLVGRGAEELRATHPDRYRDDLKRLLDLDAPVYLNGASYAVAELLAVVIRRVIQNATALTDEDIDVIRLGVPVSFEGDRAAAMRAGAQMAGFSGELDLVSEPLAASRTALAGTTGPGTWLIIDLGGGTLDLALITRDAEGAPTVLDTAGTDEIGGFVIDDAIVDLLREQCGVGQAQHLDPSELTDLIVAARSLKHQLSDATTGYARNPLSHTPRQLILTSTEIATLVTPVARSVAARAESVLRANGFSWADIAGVVPTGGATRSPALLNLLRQKGTLVVPTDPPELVTALGLVRESLENLSGPQAGAGSPISRDRLPALSCLRTIPIEAGGIAFAPDAPLLATTGKAVQIWDARTGELEFSFPGPKTSDALAWAPNGSTLALSGPKKVRLWSVLDGSDLLALDANTDRTFGVEFSPDGRLLATLGRKVQLWNPATGRRVADLPFSGESWNFWEASFSPDCSMVAAAGSDGPVRIWRLADRRLVSTLQLDGGVRCVDFAPNGTVLATAGDDSVIRIWDPATGEVLRALAGHERSVFGMAFVHSSSLLATAGQDGTLRIWDVAESTPLHTIKTAHEGSVYGVDVSADNTLLATYGSDKTVRIWGLG